MLVERDRATETGSLFSKSVEISCEIAAAPERVWALLTDGPNFTHWNSAVTRFDGQVAVGQTLDIRVPGIERSFAAKVSALEPKRRMVWQYGSPLFQGEREFKVEPAGNGKTRFVMKDNFSGMMVPFQTVTLEDVGPLSEKFTADLKKAAEAA